MDARGLILDEIADFMAFFGGLHPHGVNRHPSRFCQFGVPFRPAELVDAELSAGERKRFSRVLEELESEGLVERVSSGIGTRTTHVRPTSALMTDLFDAADEETAAAYRKALNHSTWGQELLAELQANGE